MTLSEAPVPLPSVGKLGGQSIMGWLEKQRLGRQE